MTRRRHDETADGNEVDAEAVRRLAQEMWEADGCPPAPEEDYRARAYEQLRPEKLASDYREAGTSGHCAEEFTETPGLPPDPPSLGRPLTEDEKVDEAALQSMDASDPPAYTPTKPGAPAGRT